ISLVSCWLFLARRSISSEMSTAESSCTKRNSSILESSSAIGCSKLRKVVLVIVPPGFTGHGARARGVIYVYFTVPAAAPGAASGAAGAAAGSRLRHKYHVATVRHGSQLAETSRASLRETGSPEK